MSLLIEGLEAGYGGIPAITGIDIEVKSGTIAALLGPNGAGKSTLAKAVSGLIRRHTGRVLLNGKQLPPQAHRVLREGLALVPEGRRIFPEMTVLENLQIAALPLPRSERAGGIRRQGEMFPILQERAGQHAGTLSGGEQEMLAIARALVSDPSVVIMDEPSQGLAPLVVEQVFQSIRALRESGRTVLLIEQNARTALEMADHGYVMNNGRVVDSGGAGVLQEPGRLERAYLGETA